MKFSIKNYYNISTDVSILDVINLFINDFNKYEQEIVNLIDQSANNKEFIYPNSDIQTYIKMKELILVSLLINNKLSNNPIFSLHAEIIFTCQKMLTLEVFIFFLKIIYLRLKELESFNLRSFEKIIQTYNNNLNKKYYYSPMDLLKVNFDEIKNDFVENKIESEFK